MMNTFKLLTATILTIGVLISYPTLAFDEDKCTADVGTAFNGQTTGRFCISKIQMQNWFTAFSWCRAIGGHLATRAEACNGKLNNCNNIKGSGQSDYAWLAEPKGKDKAILVNLSSGEPTNNTRHNTHYNTGTLYSIYALCK